LLYCLNALLSGYLIYRGDTDDILRLELPMKQLTEASGNSLMGGILSSAICSVGLFNCLQYMSVHTTQSKGSRLRVAGSLIFMPHFYYLVIDDPG